MKKHVRRILISLTNNATKLEKYYLEEQNTSNVSLDDYNGKNAAPDLGMTMNADLEELYPSDDDGFMTNEIGNCSISARYKATPRT